MKNKNQIFCAIDAPDLKTAENMVRAAIIPGIGIKLGLEFFTAEGPQGINHLRSVAGAETPLFMDMKYHDIPNTVAGAMKAIAQVQPTYVNIHASGGVEMMRRAKAAAGDSTKVLGVTVLTSLDDSDLAAVGQSGPAGDQVERLALLAQEAGLDGVVCSALEIERLRRACGPDFTLMVPGIRPEGAEAHDQKRTLTPVQAIEAGATYVVIGRPITQASDPKAAAMAILQSLEKMAA